ncbi:MAG: 30S ribosomal protein S12 [Nitrososphaeraceae archaeon]
MPTLRQLSYYGRKNKRRRCAVAALVGAPQKKGVIVKMGITTPRKPNSAKRKYAKVRMIVAKKIIFAHVPGIGKHGLQEYSIVLVEGGNPPDVPGVNYTMIRGVYDFDKPEEYKRRKRRSKFGTKRPIVLS